MWITEEVSDGLNNQYVIKNKISDYRGEFHIELFDSENFGQVALVNNSYVLTQKFYFIESELLAHIPSCVHKSPKKALVFGGLDVELAFLLSNIHGIKVDFIAKDMEALNFLSGFFSNFKFTLSDSRISFKQGFMGLDCKDYDIVIHLGNVMTHEFEALHKMLKKDSIFIFKVPSLALKPEVAKSVLNKASKFASILMPFSAAFLSMCNGSSYCFSSKTYHPVADLRLQASDMIDGARYYNSKLHEAVFSLPTYIKAHFKSIIKN